MSTIDWITLGAMAVGLILAIVGLFGGRKRS
jgi:hypothetical protein